MAEEKTLQSSSPEEVSVVSEKSAPMISSGEGEKEKAVTAKPCSPEKSAVVLKEVSEDGGEKKSVITKSFSFKEETNVIAELPDSQKLALEELKNLLRDALDKHHFTPIPKSEEAPVKPDQSTPPQIQSEKSPPKEEEESKIQPPADSTELEEDGAKTVEAIEESVVAAKESVPVPEKEIPAEPEGISIWGVPLLRDERSDAVLLKFLRARDFKAKDALAMINTTVQWRKDFKIEALLDEDLGENQFSKAFFMSGVDKEGHPVCYNVFGVFQDKDLYRAAFSGKEKRENFIRWRIQFLEKNIRALDFSPTGICSMVQINDLKNSPGPSKTESRLATNQAVSILQDNYPEFVAKQVFINVPWWYVAYNAVISPFITQRTKSKFVFASQSKTANTLFRYLAPEQVPVHYGGLKRDGVQEFTASDSVNEFIVKPASKHTIEFPVSEKGTALWELRVLGWEVIYGSEFVPNAEDGYTVIVQKARKVGSFEETVISGNYKITEPGNVVFTIDNQTSKKKKLFYRTKINSTIV